jgi:hypothetical protein
MEEFEKIFSYLNLEVDNIVKAYLAESSQSGAKGEFKRDSKGNIKTWKNRLSPEEISRIKEGTKTMWPKFYSEEDW